MSVYLSPRGIIESLGEANGQSTEKDATIADNLNKDIDTGFTSGGCFINELLQNADDQETDDAALPEISFVLTGEELIVFHNGKPFDEEDVRGICSYSNAKKNRKATNQEQSGYKDFGFKSVFRVAYCVKIWSRDWRFSFDERSPRWNQDKRIPWQIAPIWLEEGAPVRGDQYTVFAFKLRPGNKVREELVTLSRQPERVLFLKRISQVTLSILSEKFILTRKGSGTKEIYVNGGFRSRWSQIDDEIPLSQGMQTHLSQLGAHVCPKRLRDAKAIVLSIAYSEEVRAPTTNLYATLPAAIHTGFPFVVNAPFLLNLSREVLLEDDLNIFLIQMIAQRNFEHVRQGFSHQNFSAIHSLAYPVMHGATPTLNGVFGKEMERLQQEVPVLPPQFGTQLITVNASRLDPTEWYHRFQEVALITEGPVDVVHAKVDRTQIKARFSVREIKPEEIIAPLLVSLQTRSKELTLEQSVKTLHLLFDLFQRQQIDLSFLRQLKGIVLFTQDGQNKAPSFRLFFPDSFQPPFSLEGHFPNCPRLFVNAKYLQPGQEANWRNFLGALGILEECKFHFEPEIKVSKLQQIVEPLEVYFQRLFQTSAKVSPGTYLYRARVSLQPSDVIYHFAWFPYLSFIPLSDSYQAFFWRCLQEASGRILGHYFQTAFHADRGTAGKHSQPETYLQFVFRTQKLIRDRAGTYKYAQDLYPPSFDKENKFRATAQIPVTLTKEMEQWIGFQTTLFADDCHALVLSSQNDFDYNFYQFVMRHLLVNLRKPEKRKEILEKQWQFYATNNRWAEPARLKLWVNREAHPPFDEERNWIALDSDTFTDEEAAEFCRFFQIEPIAEYPDEVDAEPNDLLKEFIKERMYDLAFQWQRLSSKRTIRDSYEQIFLKIDRLNFFLLNNDNYHDGQAFCRGNHFYFTLDWSDDRRKIAEQLGIYLGFKGNEISLVDSILKKKPQRYRKSDALKFDSFKKECDEYKYSQQAMPQTQHAMPQKNVTPPPSPRREKKDLQPIAFDLDEPAGVSEYSPEEEAPLPTHPPSPPLGSPDLRLGSTSETSTAPLPSHPLDPHVTGVSLQQASLPTSEGESTIDEGEQLLTSIARSIPRGGGSSASPKNQTIKDKAVQALTEEEERKRKVEKKRIGRLAERYVFEQYREKYEKRFGTKAILTAGKMSISKPNSEDSVEVVWNNDPQLIPADYQDKELWDSKKPFDLQITKNIEGKLTIKKKEVKGTPDVKVHFFLGSSEWRELTHSAPGTYRIHVVTRVDSPQRGKYCYKDLLSILRTSDPRMRAFSYISKTEFTGPVIDLIPIKQEEKK